MKIAANITSNNTTESPLLGIIKQLAIQIPNATVACFAQSKVEALADKEGGIIFYKKPTNVILNFFWQKIKLPILLKKFSAGIYINDFANVCNPSKINNYLFFFNNNFLQYSTFKSKQAFVKVLNIAKHIFTTDDFIKDELVEKYGISPSKITSTYYGLPKNQKLFNFNEVEQIKNKYTNGFDYFIYPVNKSSAPYLTILLKAFSQFKKWQKSSIKLVLFLQISNSKNLIADFVNYKYKEDVFFVNEGINEDINELIAASFTLIYFCEYTMASPAMLALQQAVAVIAADNNINKSIFNNAVLYSMPTVENLILQLQYLYKNENARVQMKQHAILLLQKYNNSNAANIMQQVFLKQ